MSDLGWEYPIFMVGAVAIGIYFYYHLTRSGRVPDKVQAQRECARCKLVVKGDLSKDYRHCPFCGAKY